MTVLEPGKRVLVTGAAQGIGEAVSRRIAASGAALVLADIQGERCGAVAASLPDATAVRVDIADPESVQRMVDTTLAGGRGVDALVNVAGIDAPFRAPADVDPVHWRQIIDVNLSGTWWCCAALLGHMTARGTGRIVNVASICGTVPTPGVSPAYSASKAGIVGLTLALATELEREGVLVNAVAPGSTGSTGEPIPDAYRAAYADEQPLGFGGVEPIAHAVAHLLGPGGDWISGTVLNVSGGYWRGR